MKTRVSFALLLALGSPVGAEPPPSDRTKEPVPLPAAPSPAPAAGNLERLLSTRPVVNQALGPDEAVAVALRESPLVRGAQAELEAAIGRLSAARAETRPMLSANTFVSGGSMASIVESPPLPLARMVMGLPRGAYVDQNVMLMYPLFTSGRLRALIRQAAALRDASAAGLQTQRQEVALLTRIAYREVLAHRALVEVARTRLRENEERLRVDRARLAQEQIPAYYVQRGVAEVASAQQEVTNAERDVDISLAQLKTVMGVSLASRLELTEPLTYRPSADLIRQLTTRQRTARSTAEVTSPPSTGTSVAPELAALLRRAEQRRPELQAASQRVLGAQANAAAVQAGYRPQVNLFAMGDVAKMRGERASAGVTYGLTASIPLYTGGGQRASVQTAEAERRQQEQERERVALQVAQEVNAALLNLRAAEQNVQTAQAALEAAREEYQAASARYGVGRSIVTEVLDALTARVHAESNVVQALFQYVVAQDQLRRAVGSPDTTKATLPTRGETSAHQPEDEKQ